MLESRAAIQRRLESMKREYEFMKNLDPKDVGFVLAQKYDHFARVIQRAVRHWLARRRAQQRKEGIRLVEEEEYEETAEEKQRRERNERFYKGTSEDIHQKHKQYLEEYKAKISKQRRDELFNEMLNWRNEQNEYERKIKTNHPEEIHKAFNEQHKAHLQRECHNDAIRVEAHQRLEKLDVMQYYLVQMEEEEI